MRRIFSNNESLVEQKAKYNAMIYSITNQFPI